MDRRVQGLAGDPLTLFSHQKGAPCFHGDKRLYPDPPQRAEIYRPEGGAPACGADHLAGRLCPSWKNTQISRYIAIEDPKVLEEICRTYAPFNARIIGNCPLLIAQTFVKGRSGFERDGSFSTDREAGWQYYDCGIACQTLCLAAHDLGLGTVVMGVFDRKGLEAYLQIPEDQELMALIALGYPDESPAAPRRKETSLLLSYR